jgi:hypothetical protein
MLANFAANGADTIVIVVGNGSGFAANVTISVASVVICVITLLASQLAAVVTLCVAFAGIIVICNSLCTAHVTSLVAIFVVVRVVSGSCLAAYVTIGVASVVILVSTASLTGGHRDTAVIALVVYRTLIYVACTSFVAARSKNADSADNHNNSKNQE